ncbi:hypothetical protein [Burkholderia sp. WAC0059]|uniref:hypothetical protein n=1 Tax=Burkholderia sp. WAC0059 TaxID=2066022 RepID=UPI0011AEC582|nr:hypothetical protein [Burkholderia sp. WAC0059]
MPIDAALHADYAAPPMTPPAIPPDSELLGLAARVVERGPSDAALAMGAQQTAARLKTQA